MFTDFVVGTLFYYNGTTASNSSIDTVDLVITSMSTDPVFNQTLRIPLTIIRTPNLGVDPYADSDFLYFTEHPEFGSFRVFEGQGTSVQVKTQFDDLILSGFGEVSNPAVGFVVPSIAAAIPEPSGAELMTISSLWLGFTIFLRRRQKEGEIVISNLDQDSDFFYYHLLPSGRRHSI